ncbi:tripartite tricarboxylate transporter substrate binding protein [Variovorax humicola]|uniref:Tripartite tricarboxylate transporter substrate binding protein n=1 Tax=Variovorax humicola TaxID=1769758 RepID=A0ABU8W3M7_9BURK
MKIDRRAAVLGLGALALGISTHAADNDFPNHPVRIVVPFPAGSSPDMAARHVARVLGDTWKQPVLVDNKPGADSLIGTQDVIRSKPDGHTILLTISQVLTNPLLRRTANYDMFAHLRSVTGISTASFFLAVPASSPATNLKQYLDVAKQRDVSFGTLGPGWSGDMSMVALERQAGVQLRRIPYKGTNEIVIALGRGDIDSALLPYNTAQSGADKIRLIGTMGRERFKLLPAIATFDESGVTGLARPSWLGLFAPARTPNDVVQKISRDVNAALRNTEVTQYFDSVAFAPFITTPEEFDLFVRDDYRFYGAIVKTNNIKLD